MPGHRPGTTGALRLSDTERMVRARPMARARRVLRAHRLALATALCLALGLGGLSAALVAGQATPAHRRPPAAGGARHTGSAGRPAPAGPGAATDAVLAADRPLPAQPVRPVGRHADPVVLVLGAATLPAELRARIGAVPGTAVATLDTATVSAGGASYSALATDLGQLRDMSPGPTAASGPLWDSIARGDLVTSYEGKAAKAGSLGGPFLLRAAGTDARLRLGARAGFGIPQADLVLAPARGQQIGLTPASGLLIGALPGADVPGVAQQVQNLAQQAHLAVTLLGRAAAGTKVVAGGGTWISLYQQAATTCPGLPWQVLAAIGQVESDHGRNEGPSSAGAVGPMQFLPSTFALVAVDGNHDGTVNPYDPYDAVYTAARLLCQDGAGTASGLPGAIFAYNHADWYVREVLALAAQY